MKNPKNNYASRAGFTLVELLVVIVIIAALAALSFTVATRIRASSREVTTISNLRQMGQLHQTFAADYGNFVSNNSTIIDGKNLKWSECFAKMITGSDEGVVWDRTFKTNGVFRDATAYQANMSKMGTSGHDSWRTFAYNNTLGTPNPDQVAAGQGGWMKGAKNTIQVEYPEKLILFSMRKFGGSRFEPYMNFGENVSSMDTSSYKGRAYVAFYDGHVDGVNAKNWYSKEGKNANGVSYTTADLNRYWWGRDNAVSPGF